MKKLLGIVVLGLLWCNVGVAENKILGKGNYKKMGQGIHIDYDNNEANNIAARYCASLGMHATYYGEANWQSIPRWYSCSKKFHEYKDLWYTPTLSNKWKSKRKKYKWTSYNKSIAQTQSVSGNTTQSGSGSFTTAIGAHSATCKEIGFKPGTEKFGDCVLKLVELDIKRGGNVQAAEQFQRKRQDQGSQMLIELGLGLLSGSTTQTQTNTNQRSTCRWQSGGIGQPYMTCTTN